MAEHLSIDIPVYSYIKKYLTENNFLKRNFKLTITDPIGIFIITALEAPPKYYKPLNPNTNHYITMNKGRKKKAEIISINLAGYTDRRKTYLDHKKVMALNTLVDYLIHWEMYIYIESRTGTGYTAETYQTIINDEKVRVRKITRQHKVQTDTLINDFISKYNFNDDDLTFYSLKKWYYRYKKMQQVVN